MESRSQRLALITKIIQNEEVDSQDKLLQILNSKNCSVTQFKRPTRDGRYLYSLSNAAPEQKPNIAKSSSSMDGFLSMEMSGNLAVIKTVPAFAQPISQAIDDMDMPSIISTIAGNDTILVVIRNGFTGTNVAQDFAHYFPEIANKIK